MLFKSPSENFRANEMSLKSPSGDLGANEMSLKSSLWVLGANENNYVPGFITFINFIGVAHCIIL